MCASPVFYLRFCFVTSSSRYPKSLISPHGLKSFCDSSLIFLSPFCYFCSLCCICTEILSLFKAETVYTLPLFTTWWLTGCHITAPSIAVCLLVQYSIHIMACKISITATVALFPFITGFVKTDLNNWSSSQCAQWNIRLLESCIWSEGI